MIDDPTGERALRARTRAIEHVPAIFRGSHGGSPGSSGFNAIGEHLG